MVWQTVLYMRSGGSLPCVDIACFSNLLTYLLERLDRRL